MMNFYRTPQRQGFTLTGSPDTFIKGYNDALLISQNVSETFNFLDWSRPEPTM